MSTETKKAFKSGATSRSKARDFTLLVPESINAIVDRHQFGIDVGHDRNNWQKGASDPDFVRDRVNHFFEHAIAIVTGVHPRDKRPGNFTDVEAALCNLQMIAWYRTHGTGLAEAFPHLKEETDGSKPTQA